MIKMPLTYHEIKEITEDEGLMRVPLHLSLTKRDTRAFKLIDLLNNITPPINSHEQLAILGDAIWWIRTLSMDVTARDMEK